MAKKVMMSIGPKIRSNRDFQSRLIANLEAVDKRLWNIQAALACIADWVQIASPEMRFPGGKTKSTRGQASSAGHKWEVER